MTTNIYAVIDKDGTVINRILVDQDAAPNYWPGYGHKMIDCGPAPLETQAPPPPLKDPEWGIAKVTPSKALNVGDAIDIKTGAVTERAIEAVAEVILDDEPVKL